MINTYIQHLLLRWKLILTSRRLALFIFLLPLIISTGIGAVFKDYSAVDRVPVAIIDSDNTAASQALIEKLTRLDTLSIDQLNANEAISALSDNRVEAIFTIRPGFEAMILSGKVDDKVDITVLESNMVAGALGDIFAREIIKELAVNSASNKALRLLDSKTAHDDAMRLTKQLISESTFELELNIQLITPGQTRKNPANASLTAQKLMQNRISAGMTLASTAFFMVFVGASIIEERKTAAFDRLKCAGQPRILGAFLGYFSFGSALLFMQFLALSIMTGIFTLKDLPMLLLISSAFVSSFCGIMLLGAIQFQKGTAFQSIAAPAVFFICLAGGAFWSLDLIPEAFKIISKLTPVYWTMEALMGLTLGNAIAIMPLILLLGTGLAFSFIAEYDQ